MYWRAAQALRALGVQDRHYADLHSVDGAPTVPFWWVKPARPPRAWLSRLLSAHGCSGRISVADGVDYPAVPPPRWTAFTARTPTRGRAA